MVAGFTMDWTATILAVTGTKPDAKYPLDGINLMDVCTGSRAPVERTVFWRTTAQAAARLGKWKYLNANQQEHLFDLSTDPGEKAELKFALTDIFGSMRTQYQNWNSQMLPNPNGAGRGARG